jgi:hypothetical protein
VPVSTAPFTTILVATEDGPVLGVKVEVSECQLDLSRRPRIDHEADAVTAVSGLPSAGPIVEVELRPVVEAAGGGPARRSGGRIRSGSGLSEVASGNRNRRGECLPAADTGEDESRSTGRWSPIAAARRASHIHGETSHGVPMRAAALLAVGVALGIAVPLLDSPAPAYAAGLPFTYYQSNAGYAVFSSSIPPTTASAQFRVPALTCNKVKKAVGFGVVVENSDDSSRGSPTVGEACVKNTPIYTANININNVNTVFSTTVNPTDLITVSASETSTSTSATFTDNTTTFSQTLSGTGSTSAFGYVGSVPDEARPGIKKVAMFPHSRLPTPK